MTNALRFAVALGAASFVTVGCSSPYGEATTESDPSEPVADESSIVETKPFEKKTPDAGGADATVVTVTTDAGTADKASCSADKDCALAQLCRAGSCVAGCRYDSDCPGSQVCPPSTDMQCVDRR